LVIGIPLFVATALIRCPTSESAGLLTLKKTTGRLKQTKPIVWPASAALVGRAVGFFSFGMNVETAHAKISVLEKAGKTPEDTD
jgi:hypothetical protein